tara:strand:- start:13742 stop:14062 length:321 start_codon:yes stop_codon:yes gene_type:complete
MALEGVDHMDELNPMEVDYIEQALEYINDAWTKSIKNSIKEAEAEGKTYILGKFYADILEHDIRLKLGLPSLKAVRRIKKEKLEKEMEKMMEVEVETIDFSKDEEE